MSRILHLRPLLAIVVLTVFQQYATSFSPRVPLTLASTRTTNRDDVFRGTTATFFVSCSNSQRCMLLSPMHEASSLVTAAVEFFDGSTIVDPVVVSDVFWSRLQANLISVIIGQVLAAITFSFLLSIATSQITKLFTYVNEQIFQSSTTTTDSQKLRIPRNLRDDSSATTNNRIEPDIGKLIVCVAIDTIGSSSVLIPFIGDASDVLWAPTAGILLRYLFYNSNIILLLEFAEEILPLTDILPLATLCWIIDTYFRDSSIAKLLQLGDYSPAVTNLDRKESIDVDSREIRSKSDQNF